MKQIDKKIWKCKNCTRPATTFPETSNAEGEEGETTTEHGEPLLPTFLKKKTPKCKVCPQQIKASHLKCLACKGSYHQQMKCSGMTKKQIENLDKENWTCQSCEDEKHLKAVSNDLEPEFVVRDGREKEPNKL